MVLRILSSVVFIPPLLLLLLYGPSEWFFLLLLPVSAIVLFEWHAMSPDFSWFGLVLSIAVAWSLLIIQLPGFHIPMELPIVLFSMLLFVLSMPRYNKENNTTTKIGYQLIGVIYCAVPMTLLLDIFQEEGGKVVLFLLCVIWATDSGALFFGKWLGKRKFAVHISPGKTVAGFFGGLLSGGCGALFAGTVFSPGWTLLDTLAFGLVVSFIGQLGDLAESMLKREAGIKDSGRLIPGHGGFLDRLDSLLFATPVFFLVVRFMIGRL